MPVGTQANPFTSQLPMDIARALLRAEFRTPNNRPGLYFHAGQWLHWYGERWEHRDSDWLMRKVYLLLEETFYLGEDEAVKRFRVNSTVVQEVVVALEVACYLPYTKLPVWIGDLPTPGWDPDYTLTFEDEVVEVKSRIRTERDERWVEPMVIPAYMRGDDYGCPLWLRCLHEWSSGDELWIDLLKRWFGYCLMPHTDYARMLLMYGRIRSGKGTISKVLHALLGDGAFKGVTLSGLANRFGMEGLTEARVLNVGEVNELANREGEEAVRLIKMVLGQDAFTIDRKYQKQQTNVHVRAKIMLQSNEIPMLPDKGQGLSGKMLLLPFEQTFVGREDPDLFEKLEMELPAIATWALEGARELTDAPKAMKWPTPRGAADGLQDFLDLNCPFDSFLRARFIPEQTSFVCSDVIWAQWLDWHKRNGMDRLSYGVHRNHLNSRLIRESSWYLRKSRRATGERGLKGLALRRNPDDEG